MGLNANWAHEAACRRIDPDTLFVQGAAQNRAKAVCMGCPVRTECLADALDNRIEFGVWGGMTERERRALLRRNPEVGSWWKLLEEARQDYYDAVPRPRKPLDQAAFEDTSVHEPEVVAPDFNLVDLTRFQVV